MNLNPRKRAHYAMFGLLFLGALFILGSELANANKVSWGTKLAGKPIGGTPLNELGQKLDMIEEELQKREITILSKNAALVPRETKTAFTAHPKDLGISLDRETLNNELRGIGREKNVIVGFGRQVAALLRITNLPLRFSYNDEVLHAYITKNFPGLEDPSRNATLKFDARKNEFVLVREKTGRIVDRDQFKKTVHETLAHDKPTTLALELTTDIPAVTSDEIGEARKNAERILAAGPYTLRFEDTIWEVEKEDLVSWITFSSKEKEGNSILHAELSQERIRDYLTPLSTGLNRPPVNAVFAMKDDKVTTFSLSKNGVELLLDESALRIKEKIENERNEKLIELTIHITKPEITSERINDLHITKRLSVGESDFAGSPKNRTHNIKIGSQKFHGVLVKPGEEFSFNKILGEVSAETGYLAELVIKKDKTVPEFGGGLCQVSTTLFRAAVRAGFEITERFPHAFAVKYYSPQGFDATIYPPHPDLRFINDTPSYILVQTRVEKTKLVFELYGSDDGRVTEVTDPVQYDIKKDGSMKAKFTQKVTQNGEMIREKTFYSNYKSPLLYPVQRNPLE